ncbi:lmo0954 family membrane protein [Pseudoneobacillus sp. C159]
MNKFGLLLVGGIAAIVLFHTIGPIIGLAISLLLFYLIVKQFLKTKSTGGKIGYGILGLMVLSAVISHAPALLGVAAAYVLYVVYKKWNANKVSIAKESGDPFANFEKQWNEIVK